MSARDVGREISAIRGNKSRHWEAYWSMACTVKEMEKESSRQEEELQKQKERFGAILDTLRFVNISPISNLQWQHWCKFETMNCRVCVFWLTRHMLIQRHKRWSVFLEYVTCGRKSWSTWETTWIVRRKCSRTLTLVKRAEGGGGLH